MRVDDAIEQLGQRIGFKLELDDNRACRLVFDGTLPVDLEAPSSLPDTLVMTCKVGASLPAAERESVYRALLEGNLFGRETGGATFAFDEDRDEIVLQRMLKMSHATFQDVVDALELLLQHAEAWIARLKNWSAPGNGDRIDALSVSTMLKI